MVGGLPRKGRRVPCTRGPLASALTAALALALIGCRPSPPPIDCDYHVAGLEAPEPRPELPPVPDADPARGLVAYERDGVVYVREVFGERATERRVAPVEGRPGPVEALCPTFLPSGLLMVVDPGHGLWVLDPLSDAGTQVLRTRDVIALGVHQKDQEPLIGLVQGGAGETETDWQVAQLHEWRDVIPIGIARNSVNPPSMHHNRSHRLRASANMGLIAVPRFPTGVSAGYELLWRWPWRGFDLVDWSADDPSGEDWFTSHSAGVDFGAPGTNDEGGDETTIYVATWAIHDALTGGPATSDTRDYDVLSGICKLSKQAPDERTWVVPMQTEYGLGELAVSERLGVAAVEAQEENSDTCQVALYGLSNGRLLSTADGSDPDIWPR